MIPLVRSIVYALLWDERAVRRWLRGLAVSFAVGGATFADQAAAIIGRPDWTTKIKLAALVLAFIGGAISVGEKNPDPAEPAPIPLTDPASGDGA